MDSASSFGSQYSLYSIEGGKGNYDITGEVLFGVTHKDGLLTVNVERAKGLAATDKGGFSNPYIKTYLLPDKSKHSKKKTEVKHKTTDPYYGEVLKVMVQLFFIIYYLFFTGPTAHAVQAVPIRGATSYSVVERVGF